MKLQDFIHKQKGRAITVAIPVDLVHWLGDYETAALLAQLIYWSGRTKNAEGWIYKTYENWNTELGLSESVARARIRRLREMGIIETKLKKANGNPTVHYRVRADNLKASLREFLERGA